MPAPTRQLSLLDASRHIDDRCFTPTPGEACGLELEWLTACPGRGGDRPSLETLESIRTDAASHLPHASPVSIEPGGQIELSTRPQTCAASACETAADDLLALEQLCRSRGVELMALGADPSRPPRRLLTAPRYQAMEAYFASRHEEGLAMMANTAAIQINVGLGADHSAMTRRWRLANQIGPSLIASFANSPISGGAPTGWQSSRLRSWWALDPGRVAPVPLDEDPHTAWARYALAADVMLIRRSAGDHVALRDPLPLGKWISDGHELGWPTLDDIDYHLSTLFPPVRPRGWFELRIFDALPTPFWHVAVSVVTALLDNPDAAARATSAVAGTEHLWVESSREGLRNPALARSAEAIFAIALRCLEEQPGQVAHAVVAAYYDRWIARSRSPADDRIDRWREAGEIVPAAESPIPYAAFEEVTP